MIIDLSKIIGMKDSNGFEELFESFEQLKLKGEEQENRRALEYVNNNIKRRNEFRKMKKEVLTKQKELTDKALEIFENEVGLTEVARELSKVLKAYALDINCVTDFIQETIICPLDKEALISMVSMRSLSNGWSEALYQKTN